MYWRDGDSFVLKRDLAKGEFRCVTALRRGTDGVVLEVKYGEAWVRFDSVQTSKGSAEASFPVTELATLIDPVHAAPAAQSEEKNQQ